MNIPQRFNEVFAQELAKRTMLVIPYEWIEKAIEALSFASPLTLGVSPEEFSRLARIVPCAADEFITLYDFANLSNNLEARTPKDLGLSLPDYSMLMEIVGVQSKRWNDITKGLRDEVNKNVAEEFQMKEAAEKGASGTEVLKPVMGKA